jgi:hypothetical protein
LNTALREVAKILGINHHDFEKEGAAQGSNGGGWTTLTQGSKAAADQLCATRGFTLEGLRLARDRGVLAFGTVCTAPCWVVTDRERVSAQARRLDGKWFPPFKSLAERKSHTLKGSRQGHVIGSADVGNYDFLLLVEGGPDVIAAHCFIAASEMAEKIGVLGIMGVVHPFPAKLARACAGKHVRVFGHADIAGQEAAARWRMVLRAKGVRRDVFTFHPPISDLNELLTNESHPDCAWVTKFAAAA